MLYLYDAKSDFFFASMLRVHVTLKLIDETRFAPDPADVEEEEVDEEDEDEQ
jgi:hypothetical protein